MRVIRLENVPTSEFLESQDHQHDLVRELQLIHFGAQLEAPVVEVSHRLAELIADILARYDQVRAATRNQAIAALERGQAAVTLEIPVQEGMADALRQWLALLDEADRIAAEGELLIVPARPELRRLRAWYVEQLVTALEDR